MTRRTFQGDTFRARSLAGLTGRASPSRALSSSLRSPGAIGMMCHSMAIERLTVTNVDGEAVHAWEEFDENVPCLIQEKKGVYTSGRDGRSIEYDAVAFVPIDCEIQSQGTDELGDRIIWLSIEPNVTFSVVMATDESGMADHLTCYLRKFAPAN